MNIEQKDISTALKLGLAIAFHSREGYIMAITTPSSREELKAGERADLGLILMGDGIYAITTATEDGEAFLMLLDEERMAVAS